MLRFWLTSFLSRHWPDSSSIDSRTRKYSRRPDQCSSHCSHPNGHMGRRPRRCFVVNRRPPPVASLPVTTDLTDRSPACRSKQCWERRTHSKCYSRSTCCHHDRRQYSGANDSTLYQVHRSAV